MTLSSNCRLKKKKKDEARDAPSGAVLEAIPLVLRNC